MKCSDKVNIGDDLVSILEDTEEIDDRFLNILIDIAKAALTIQLFLIHLSNVLIGCDVGTTS